MSNIITTTTPIPILTTTTMTSSSPDLTALGPYLAKLSARGETRRVRLPRDIDWSSFTQLIQSYFPHLVDKHFTVTYQDEEGDDISLSTTHELREALSLNEQLALPKCLLFSIDSNDLSDAASISSWRSSIVDGPLLEPISVDHDQLQPQQQEQQQHHPKDIPLPPSPCISPDLLSSSMSSSSSPDAVLPILPTTTTATTITTSEPTVDASNSDITNNSINNDTSVSKSFTIPIVSDEQPDIIPVNIILPTTKTIPTTPRSIKSRSHRINNKSTSTKLPRPRINNIIASSASPSPSASSSHARQWPYIIKSTSPKQRRRIIMKPSSLSSFSSEPSSPSHMDLSPLTDILNDIELTSPTNHYVIPTVAIDVNRQHDDTLLREHLQRQEAMFRRRQEQLQRERLAHELALKKQHEIQLQLAHEAARQRILAEQQAAYWAQAEQAARLRALRSSFIDNYPSTVYFTTF